jgi:uncharacterized membrane protein
MRTALVVVAGLAALDLLACGLLLALAWAEHARLRRRARRAGEPVPPAATGQFLFLAALGLAGGAALYGTLWLLLAG